MGYNSAFSITSFSASAPKYMRTCEYIIKYKVGTKVEQNYRKTTSNGSSWQVGKDNPANVRVSVCECINS